MSRAPAPATPAAHRVAVSGRPVPPRWAYTLPLMLASGALVAIQSQINGALADGLGAGLRAAALAAVISFGSGLVVLTVFALLFRPMGRGILALARQVARRHLPLWLVLGGLGGAFFVASQGVAAGALGITFFVLCVVAGQAVMALLVDHFGWGPNGRTELSSGRVAGAVMAVLAVAISGAGLAAAVPLTGLLFLLAALPLVAGAISSLQQGVNGRLAREVGPWVTTWNNFVVGTLGLLVFLGATFALPGRLAAPPTTPWLYVGGICGIGFIWASTVTVRVHGVLVVGVFAVAGQVLTAAVIALVVSGPPPVTTWLAVATSLLGAAAVGLGQRARLTPRPARSR